MINCNTGKENLKGSNHLSGSNIIEYKSALPNKTNVKQEIVNTTATLRLNHSLSILLIETGELDKNTRKA